MMSDPEESRIAADIHREYPPSAGAQAMARLMTHEEVCALRYKGIIDRVARLETIAVRIAAALLVGMGGIIATLLLHAPLAAR